MRGLPEKGNKSRLTGRSLKDGLETRILVTTAVGTNPYICPDQRSSHSLFLTEFAALQNLNTC
jgi:hypothetical protein